MNEAPVRGFAESEYRARTERAQVLMAASGLDAMLLTTEADLRYFTWFLTQFWQSPTRPWFLVVPAAAALLPEHVLDAIGYACTSGATVLGEDKVNALIAEVQPGVPATNPLSALKAACRALNVTRLGLVSPYVAQVSDMLRLAGAGDLAPGAGLPADAPLA